MYLTKLSTNKEVSSVAKTVSLPFRMLISGENENTIPFSENIIYYCLALTGMHGC